MHVRRTSSLIAVCSAASMLLLACSNEAKPVAIAATTTTVSTAIEDVAASTTTRASVTETPAPQSSTKQPTGVELYAQTCLGMLEFFDGFRDLAKEAGEPFDATSAADEMMNAVTSGELSGEADELVWTDLSASDQAQFKRGLYAAANGKC